MNSWKRAHSQTAECNHKPLGGHRNDYNHFNMNVIEQFLELEFKYFKKMKKKKMKMKKKRTSGHLLSSIRVLVRMILQCQLPIRLLDFLRCCCLADLKHIIQIGLLLLRHD